MGYLKERNKMIMLLVIGLMLLIGVLYLVNLSGNSLFFASFGGIFMMLALILYPLALVYGRSQIVDIFHSIRIGARQPFRPQKSTSSWNFLFKLLNTCFAFGTVVFFGWIYGAYTAYQKLQMLKSFYIK